jgi:DtxR family Mn-dependent transcriptional regulator
LKVKLKNLSLTKQNYIETIFELSREKGFAKTKEISEKLNVKMPSVTEMLKQLSSLDLIMHEKGREVFLTDSGKALARKLEYRQNILVQLLKKIGCSRAHSEKVACKLEHYIDGETVKRLESLIDSLKNQETP